MRAKPRIRRVSARRACNDSLLRLDESGAAVVEFVFVLPVLLLLICAVLDASAYIKAGITVDTAATAAVRYLMDNPSAAATATVNQELGEYLARVDEAFTGKGTSVEVGAGAADISHYTHRFYMDTGDGDVLLERKDSAITTQPVAVAVSYNGAFLTPLGKAISLATGADGRLSVKAVQSGYIDLTGGSTW